MLSNQCVNIIDQYRNDGYVVIRNVLNPVTDLLPVIKEYGELANKLANQWLGQGIITSYDKNAPEENRLLQLMKQTDGNCFQELDITLPVEAEIKEDSPVHLGEAIFNLLRNQTILDVVENIIGSEIYSVPVQHMRIKPPEAQITDETQSHTLTLTGKTFWHQDLAVVTQDADNTDMLSVWLPLNEATEKNGCLVVIPGSHTKGLVHHCDTPVLQGIPDSLIGENIRPIPAKPGDMVLLHPLMIHASLSNISTHGRWSLDLRYCPTGQPTGRRWFPGFIARSKSHPEKELSDYEVWVESWHFARQTLAGQPHPKFDRWDKNDPSPLCA
ncbi:MULTISPECIES: phytanoyl-CoA dioxygenase family protein [Photorhabdus]|uniref:Phytanoyl-CoA dioxygenase n=2 Tax=Photorhabdus asymbiotica TaxID=291112 RepID=C7BGQ7_PHOAA|nr:phytanoyl-CoA dioxygenase family protein [Photorhabdus asymbiotica]RKS54598.1 ectoine hydroxylase-related dioxygenase (phytanoyl-CoA dioxygenase family) [Photorhabdus asymbiotica]CAQ82236.1 conserved hypothetical protein [Photorhabdus asymbiotica]